MKYAILFLSIITFPYIIAQPSQFCGTDSITRAIYDERPDLRAGMVNGTEKLRTFTEEFKNTPVLKEDSGPYIIPVVFHIIHDYGTNNISEEQIKDGLRLVNEQFRLQNEDTSNIIDEFKHLAADTEIEFRLAKLDPDGNCTNGITRTFSPLTYSGSHDVKSIVQWPPDQYLNIWVCRSLPTGLAGHCLMPGVADTIPEWDGIVISHSYVGEIGTSAPNKRTVLTHEIGHYLNLYHIWGGNNVPDFYYLPVGSSDNCEHDDEVEDTPNTIGWSSCNLSAESCGSLDMVQNYMDYSYCSLLFTHGQKERMHAALNSDVANRNNLWTEENLIATGIMPSADDLCKVDIQTPTQTICTGEELEIADISYHQIVARNWTFEGANISTSTDSTVLISYDEPGTYDINLEVSNGTTTIDSTFKNYIRVVPSIASINYLSDGFETEEKFNQQWIFGHDDIPNFERNPIGKDSDYGLFANNYDLEMRHDFTISSIPINATDYSDLAITFDYAYAKADDIATTESIITQLSKDCGETWQTRRKILLSQNYSIESNDKYTPQEEDWISVEQTFPITQYNVENLRVRILFEARNGNNLYMDNINISDVSIMNTSNEIFDNQFKVYPNPAQNQITIKTKETIAGKIKIHTILGEEVYANSVENSMETTINVSHLSRGTYFVIYEPKNQNGNPLRQKIVLY